MSYRHTWEVINHISDKDWATIVPMIKTIEELAKERGTRLTSEDHHTKAPQEGIYVDDSTINFNGDLRDKTLFREEFYFERKMRSRVRKQATFCNTNYYPYDFYVCLCLLAIMSVVPEERFRLVMVDGSYEWTPIMLKFAELFPYQTPTGLVLRLENVIMASLDEEHQKKYEERGGSLCKVFKIDS